MLDQASRSGADASASQLAALQMAIRRCVRCPALTRSRSQAVPGDGAIPARVCMVGLAPGRLGGDRTGIPFSGDRSGNLLREMIDKVGLTRVFITNLVRCNPRDPAGRNRDPDRNEIANCRDYLRAELELARPRVVVCLGRVAWRELAGPGNAFTPEAPHLLRTGSFELYPMYHPAYVTRGAYSIRAYMRAFRRLAHLLNIVEPLTAD